MEKFKNSGKAMEAANHSKNSAGEAENSVKHGAKLKKYLVLCVFVFISSFALAQGNLQDVIHLRNGSIIRGVIIEQVPNVSIRLQTVDGNIFVFQIDEIERMTREQPIGFQQQGRHRPHNFRSPALAWCLSFFIPGAGQFYNGDIGKGIGFLAANLVGHSLLIGGATSDNVAIARTGLIIAFSSWVWAQIDAPINANRINREAAGFASWNLGSGDTILSLQPDFNFTPIAPGQKKALIPTYGIGLRINF